MVEIWEEEGEQDSEWRDGPGDEIGSDSVLESIRNFPMYSPPRSLTDWRADQVQSPPLDLFGLQFGYEAYLPPATTTVCNIEASRGYEASLFGLQFEYEAGLPPATTTVCNIEDGTSRSQRILIGEMLRSQLRTQRILRDRLLRLQRILDRRANFGDFGQWD